MKTFNEKLDNLIIVLSKIVLAICIGLVTCGLFNFMLVAPLQTSVLGTIMLEVKEQNENIDVMFLGSSRTYCDVDAPYLSENLDKNIFNIASNSVTYISLYHLLIELCKSNKPEKVFLEVSSVNFKRDRGTEDSYIFQSLSGENQEHYKNAISFNYQKLGIFDFVNYLNNFANGKFTQNIAYKLKNDYSIGSGINSNKITYKGHGYSYYNLNFVGKNIQLPKSYFTNGEFWGENSFNSDALEYFLKIIDYCKNNNIDIVLYSLPYPQEIIEKYYDGFVDFDNSLKRIIKDFTDITYLDFSKIKPEYMELSLDYFYDVNHCNGKGAEMLTPIIYDIYNELENDTFSYENWFYNEFEDLVNFHSVN